MEDKRVLVGTMAEVFEDVAGLPDEDRAQVLDPGSYTVSQAYGRGLRDRGSNGVVYPSVRRSAGTCVGAFRPRAVGLPMQERHLKHRWNGDRVDRYFDYLRGEWVEV